MTTQNYVDVGEQVLKPILDMRDLTVGDRAEVERLIREADKASAAFLAHPPTGIAIDLYIERIH